MNLDQYYVKRRASTELTKQFERYIRTDVSYHEIVAFPELVNEFRKLVDRYTNLEVEQSIELLGWANMSDIIIPNLPKELTTLLYAQFTSQYIEKLLHKQQQCDWDNRFTEFAHAHEISEQFLRYIKSTQCGTNLILKINPRFKLAFFDVVEKLLLGLKQLQSFDCTACLSLRHDSDSAFYDVLRLVNNQLFDFSYYRKQYEFAAAIINYLYERYNGNQTRERAKAILQTAVNTWAMEQQAVLS
jgi:hypothetical protein